MGKRLACFFYKHQAVKGFKRHGFFERIDQILPDFSGLPVHPQIQKIHALQSCRCDRGFHPHLILMMQQQAVEGDSSIF